MLSRKRIYMIWWDNGEHVPELYEHDVDRFFFSMEEAEQFLVDCGFARYDEFLWRKLDEEHTISSGRWFAQIRIFEPGKPEIRPLNPANVYGTPFDNVDDEDAGFLRYEAGQAAAAEGSEPNEGVAVRESTYTLSDGTKTRDLLCANCGNVVYPEETRCMTCGAELAV